MVLVRRVAKKFGSLSWRQRMLLRCVGLKGKASNADFKVALRGCGAGFGHSALTLCAQGISPGSSYPKACDAFWADQRCIRPMLGATTISG